MWEARPLFDGRWQPTIYDKLGVIGNVAVLLSGADTIDRVRIAEVRRYTPQGLSYPLQEMLAELGADLLPDVADDRARAAVYESLYGFERCAHGFVAMRFLWPNGVATATKKQTTCCNTGPVACMSLARISRDVSEVASSGSAHSAASTDVLWLVLEESRYDAIASGRLRWEARPRDGTVREINNHLRDPYFDWTLAERGRSGVLHMGNGHRYMPQTCQYIGRDNCPGAYFQFCAPNVEIW